MKLNLDCVRDLLLTLEERLVLDDSLTFHFLRLHEVQECEPMNTYSRRDIVYCSLKLVEAGYVDAKLEKNRTFVRDITYMHLTYNGHVFLDGARCKDVWEQVKNSLAKAGGVSGLRIVASLAEKILFRHLGL